MGTPARVLRPAPVKAAVLAAHGLTKVYTLGDVAVHALRGVDLDLRETELMVLLGPSGSGKSTLLNILGGLDLPTGGEVYYRGQNLTTLVEVSTPVSGVYAMLDHAIFRTAKGALGMLKVTGPSRPDIYSGTEPYDTMAEMRH